MSEKVLEALEEHLKRHVKHKRQENCQLLYRIKKYTKYLETGEGNPHQISKDDARDVLPEVKVGSAVGFSRLALDGGPAPLTGRSFPEVPEGYLSAAREFYRKVGEKEEVKETLDELAGIYGELYEDGDVRKRHSGSIDVLASVLMEADLQDKGDLLSSDVWEKLDKDLRKEVMVMTWVNEYLRKLYRKWRECCEVEEYKGELPDELKQRLEGVL